MNVDAIRKAAEDLRAARSEAEAVEAKQLEALGRLAGGVAHDFNNLLQSVLGNGESLLESLPEGAPERAQVQEILNAGRRAASLTQQLLAYGRRQMLQASEIDLNDLVRDAMKVLEPFLGAVVRLGVSLCREPAPVHVDRTQMDRVVINLCLNARDAKGGGGSIAVETALVRASAPDGASGLEPGRYARLTVRDDGIGMSDATQKRVFEPFFTTKEFGKNYGLGLATVYGIVKQHGGHVEVTSRLGAGSEFRVFLPLVPGT